MGNPKKGSASDSENVPDKQEELVNLELTTKEDFSAEAERVDVLFNAVDNTISALAVSAAKDVKDLGERLDAFKMVADEIVTELKALKQTVETEKTGPVMGVSPQETDPKSLGNTDADGATENVPDIEFFGDGDAFKLISKASSQNEGWMKSTKAMQIDGLGCLVQVTTQQRNPDGSYAVAEALTFVVGAKIEEPSIGGASTKNRMLVK